MCSLGKQQFRQREQRQRAEAGLCLVGSRNSTELTVAVAEETSDLLVFLFTCCLFSSLKACIL